MHRLLLLFLAILAPLASEAALISTGPNGCSLADAIRSANTDSAVGNCAAGSGNDTIVAPDGWFVAIGSTLPTVNSELTIRSETAAGVFTISGDFDHKILRVTGATSRLTLLRVALVNGRVGSATGTGGAALDIDQATVNLVDAEVSGNSVTDNTGSAIHVDQGTLIIERSRVHGNSMRITGNFSPVRTAIFARDSQVEVFDSEFFDNLGAEPDLVSASLFMDGGELLFENSLVDEFRFGLKGEGAVVTIVNSTFHTSMDTGYPDELVHFTDSSSVSLRHVTLGERTVLQDSLLSAVNTVFHRCEFDNVTTILDSGNYNRIGNCRGAADGEGGLLPLADNGGPTRTRAIGPTSSLIDAADPAFCEATDQRGVARVFACDIGAFELAGVADVGVTATIDPAPPYVGGQALATNLRIANGGPGLATDLELDLALTNADLGTIDSPLCTAFPCLLSSLQPGQAVNVPITVIARDLPGTDLIIDASVISTGSSTHQDPDESNPLGNNFVQAGGAILSGADVSVEMNLLTPGPYFVGQAVKHEVIVRNAGPRTATGTTMLFLPDGLGLLGFEDCPAAAGQSCSIGSLVPGAALTVTASSEVLAGQFDAAAEVLATELDPVPGNNRDSLGNGGGVADGNLGVEVVLLTPAPHYGGQFLEFEIRLTALQGDLSNILINSELPGADFIGIDGCSSGLPCRLPFSIPAGTTRTIGADWFAPVRDPAGPGLWSHTVTAYPGENELDPADNVSTVARPLAFAADIAAQLQLVTPPPYFEHQEIEYALRVVNGGLSDASSVAIQLLPENLSLVFAAGQQCPTVDCLLAGLGRFNDENLTLVYRIDAAGAFDLAADATAAELDPVPANNLDASGNGATAGAVPDLDLIHGDGFE